MTPRSAAVPARAEMALRVAEGLGPVDEAEVVIVAVDGRELMAHARPVRIHLFGEDHRDRGDDRLAHLGAVDAEGDGAVGGDLDPRVQCDGRGSGGSEVRRGVPVIQAAAPVTDEQGAAGGEAGDDQGTA
jgi:hypothetical protein